MCRFQYRFTGAPVTGQGVGLLWPLRLFEKKTEWNREEILRLCAAEVGGAEAFCFYKRKGENKSAVPPLAEKRARQDMIESIKKDIDAIKERDPAARSTLEVLLLYPGLHALILHRPAHWLYKRKVYFPARLLSQLSRFVTGIEIHPGAKVGRGVLIDHGSGVVIGETAEVGDNCTIYQGVTLGGTGKDMGKRHPTLGNNVLVGSGAKILGPFKIGDGSKIASNAVVLQPIPPDSTAVGVPARVVRRNGKRVSQLDHVHTPDPVSQEICKLQAEVKRLSKRLENMEKATVLSPYQAVDGRKENAE